MLSIHPTPTVVTTPIADLWASWNDLHEFVDVEIKASPQIKQWIKGQVTDQFQFNGSPPICCPHLPAIRVPAAVIEINDSRNNNEAIQYYMDQNRFWLAHRMLFQAQFMSAVRFNQDEYYFLAEEGEPTVQVNGRPLTEAERWQLVHEPEKMDMKDLQPTNMKMKLGVVMRIPPYTVYCFLVAEDSLVTAGCIVPRGYERMIGDL